jgi:hypothetical protein
MPLDARSKITMNLGRRHFLKFVASAIAGTQADSLSSIYRSPTVFVDKKLGFGFNIPQGWYLETFREDFNKLLGGQKLAEPYANDKEVLEDLAQGLMATLSKYPLQEDSPQRFSPSVTFFKDTDDCLDDYQDLLDLSSHALSGFSEVLTDYECTESPRYLDRSDCIIVRSKSKFLFEHEYLDSPLIDDETFLVHHHKSIYTIHLYDSPYIGDTSQGEFELFKTSLHIA